MLVKGVFQTNLTQCSCIRTSDLLTDVQGNRCLVTATKINENDYSKVFLYYKAAKKILFW